MNDLTIFNHKDFGNVRVVSVDDSPWWVLLDVGRILGMKNTSVISSRLDGDLGQGFIGSWRIAKG